MKHWAAEDIIMAILCWFLSVACIIGSLETVSGESYPDGPEGWENLV